MNPNDAIGLLTSLVGLGVSILLAGIPWAYSVHGRLATIEASLRETLGAPGRMVELERRVTKVELQLTQGRAPRK
jgi:hypothetical protein